MKKTHRFDVSCRLLFVADIDESLLEHGEGFLAHVLEQEALRLLKEGKRSKDFHLSIIQAREMPPKIITQNKKDDSEEAHDAD